MLSYIASTIILLSSASEVLSAPTTWKLWNGTSGSNPDVSSTTVSNCSSNSYSLVSNDHGIWPYRTYKTSNATSPEFVITQNGQSLAPGEIFLTLADTGLSGYAGVKQQGAVIMSSDGDLVWFGPTGATSNFLVQQLFGENVITNWMGTGSAASGGGAAHGYGQVDIRNEKYETMYTVCPSPEELKIVLPPGLQTSCVADVHESYVTESNTMLVTVYNLTTGDLTSVGGPANGYIYTSLAVEVDIKTNEVLWMWNPQEHVPFTASHEPVNGSGTNSSDPYDWFHMNSIQSFNGGYLINSRQTWTSYFVNRNGTIEWELNGETGGSFGPISAEAFFSWEHDARLHSIGDDTKQVLYTCFNDDNGGLSTNPNSSVGLGLILSLPPNKNVSPQIYTHLVDTKQAPAAFAEGSYQILENDDGFVGYGVKPFMKEFGNSSNGTDVKWSAQFAYNNLNNTASSYRAFKQIWSATPTTSPVLVVSASSNSSSDPLSYCAAGTSARGYVSWNGATDVSRYDLYAGASANTLSFVGAFVAQGFETEFAIPTSAAYVRVVAVQADGQTGESSIVEIE